MTETTTARSSSAGQGFPDAIGFGFAELLVLLNLRRGPAAEASARALRLEGELDDAPCSRREHPPWWPAVQPL
ncbi:hypothetical protein [Arthrobacter nitrophenolicus]|uniref:Uncharacterized protein n=1 Tax=Arthrobacter nitrophenolicus TaxID=683150 RepID=L8TTY5_9MICC|nr:hypothetical protein [Arthrobacter nitrophenolicus]ELT45181.1 hypothetical protein G205_06598 [Arthrobacter nitrophenolicus]